MVLSQNGAALARIWVALFEVGFARATTKIYKSPPLDRKVPDALRRTQTGLLRS